MPAAPPAQTGHSDGDVIVANIGAGASEVAVGKNIHQTILNALGPPTKDDRVQIDQQFAELKTIVSTHGTDDIGMANMAAFQLNLLRAKLLKTDGGEMPSASTITQAGDWLLDNETRLNEAPTTMFALPAVGRVLARAGNTALLWARRWFA